MCIDQLSNQDSIHLNTICCDRQFLLSEEINSEQFNSSKIYSNCPEIIVEISKIPLSALIDTGSNITCLNESWFVENKHKLSEYEELPVSNTFIKTATGEKSKRVSKILLLPIEIENQKIHIQTLLVPHLVKPLIIGTDVLSLWEARIDFEHKVINININNNNVNLKFGQVTIDGISCYIEYSNNDIYNYEDDIIYDNIIKINKNSINTSKPKCSINPTTVKESLTGNQLMSDEQCSQLTELILKYKDIFSDEPGVCNKYQHNLMVENPQNFKRKTYPVPLAHQSKVLQEIERMESLNIIERCHSTFINPIIPVIKKSGDVRLCLDARSINQVITPDYECNRSVNELLAKCPHAKFISSIDLTSSYWQIPLTEESKQYTAFQFNGKTYQYRVTPFGISTSQAALVRALDKVFDESVENFTMIYVDDICIVSQDFESHLKYLNYIFQKLKEANMTVKFTKSQFCQSSVPFLGYTLTENGLEMDQNRMKPILDFPTPRNRTELKSFLGCINYYNKFIDRFSHTVQPLLRLTSKKNKFVWTKKDDETFREVKNLFLKTNVLFHPDPKKTFYLQTDASDVAISGHVYQYLASGDRVAIMFLSRTLQPAEQRYTTTEKELLAIVFCLQKIRYIVLGSRLNIITDNHAVTFLKTCNLRNNRLTRWILAIQEFDFEITHCKGTENITADTLSRITPVDYNSTPNTPIELTLNYIQRTQDPELQQELLNLSHHQSLDPRLQRPYQILTNGPQDQNYPQMSQSYKLHNQILYQLSRNSWLICVPENIIERLIWECHHFYLHCGAKKCFQMLSETFIFKNMHRRIRTTLASCDTCQRCKSNPHPNRGTAQGIKCFAKNDQVAVDVIGPLPASSSNVKYILIILDIYTKFVKLYPMQRATTKIILSKLFDKHFKEFGLPKRIQSDNATQFKSDLWIETLEKHDINPVYSPLYHPCFNLAERPIKEIKRCLRTYCSRQHKNWAKHITDINDCLNEVCHETTGFSPNELQLGTKDVRFWERYVSNPFTQNLPLERKLFLASERILTKRQKRAEKENRRTNPITFNLGDLVLVKNHPISCAAYGETAKLFELFEGPFKIVKQLGHSTYNVADLEEGIEYGPYHVSALKRYISPRNLH